MLALVGWWGCGRVEPEPPAAPPPTRGTELPASSTTRAQLGLSTWDVAQQGGCGPGAQLLVTGRDEAGHPVREGRFLWKLDSDFSARTSEEALARALSLGKVWEEGRFWRADEPHGELALAEQVALTHRLVEDLFSYEAASPDSVPRTASMLTWALGELLPLLEARTPSCAAGDMRATLMQCVDGASPAALLGVERAAWAMERVRPQGLCTEAEPVAQRLCVALRVGTLRRQLLLERSLDGQLSAREPLAALPEGAEQAARASCNPGDALYDALAADRASATLRVDEAALERCLQKASALTSARVPWVEVLPGGSHAAEDADCRAALQGMLPAAAACLRHHQCQPGLRCEAAAQGHALECRAPAAAEEGCWPGRSCASGLLCVEGRCQAPLPEDAPCSDEAPPCAEPLLCLRSAQEAQGHCRAPLAEGAPCEEDLHCASLLCDPALGTCAALPAPLPDAAPCVRGRDRCARETSSCAPLRPWDEQSDASNVPATCRDRGLPGEACFNTGDCQATLECWAGVCTAMAAHQPVGGPCVESDDCSSGLLCDGTGSCRAPRLPWTTCTAEDTCLEGYCDGRLCRPGALVGEPCLTEGEESTCAEGRCQEGRCTPFLPGDACDEEAATCGDGLRCLVQQDGSLSCQRLPEPGDPSMDGLCPEGTFPRLSDGVCAPQRDKDQPCEDAAECTSGVCTPEGRCGQQSAPLPDAAELSRALMLGMP